VRARRLDPERRSVGPGVNGSRTGRRSPWLLVAVVGLAVGPLVACSSTAVAAPPEGRTPVDLYRANLRTGAMHLPGEVLVRAVGHGPPDGAASQTGCTLDRQLGNRPIYLYRCPVTVPMERLLAAWQSMDGVVWVEPSWLEELAATPDDLGPEQWHHANTGQVIDGVAGTPGADLDSEAAWDRTTGHTSLVVAVVDNGIRSDHEDLVGQIWINDDEDCSGGVDDDANGYVDDCAGWDFGDVDNDPDPTALPDTKPDGSTCFRKHGTFMAALAGAAGDNGVGLAGVCWDVALMNLKKHPDATCESTSSLSVEAMYYAIDNGADVLVLSFKTKGHVQSMQEALAEADTAGLVTVMSAGNSGLDLDATTVYPVHYDFINGIVVANTNNLDELKSSSNYGETSVHIAAPGTDLYSADVDSTSDYAVASGTSYAAPLVGGAAALAWAAYPTLSATEVVEAILDGAEYVAALDCGSSSACVSTSGRLDLVGMLDLAEEIDGRMPDLVVSSVELSSQSGAPGDLVRIDYTGGNDGTGSAGPFRVSVRFSEDATLTADDPEACHAGSTGVEAGGSGRFFVDSCPIPGLAGGTWTVGVLMDSEEAIDELDETNNAAWDPDPFTVLEPALEVVGWTVVDDGTGDSVGDGDGVVEAGEAVELYVNVANTGNLDAEGVSLHLSTTATDIAVSRDQVAVGDVLAGGIATVAQPLGFVVSSTCAVDQTAVLDLDLDDDAGRTWQDVIDVEVVCVVDEDEHPGGCGCSGVGVGGPWLVLLAVLGARRRRDPAPTPAVRGETAKHAGRHSTFPGAATGGTERPAARDSTQCAPSSTQEGADPLRCSKCGRVLRVHAVVRGA